MSYPVGPASGLYFNCLHVEDYVRAAQFSTSVMQSSTATYQPAPNVATLQDINDENLRLASHPSVVYPYESPCALSTVDDLVAARVANPVYTPSSTPILSVHQDNVYFDLPSGLKRQELVQNGLLPQLETMQLMRSEHRKSKARAQLSPREDARKCARREKNKLAAAKCRIKRRQFSKSLKEENESTEKLNTELKAEVKELTSHIERLEGLLESHDCLLSMEKLEAVRQRIEMMAEDGIGEEAICPVTFGESVESDDDETVLNSGSCSSPFQIT